MMRYYDSVSRQIIYCKSAATSDFWDAHWNGEDVVAMHLAPRNSMVKNVTRKFIRYCGRILEGGCGPATTVAVLEKDGHVAVGLDFALGTLRVVQTVAPHLRLAAGDVFRLPFVDASFDAYWSLGVIEHFYEGYHGILLEANRVVRPGGYLFLTFPWMSPLRRLRARLRCYRARPAHFDPEQDGFYQYALDGVAVRAALARVGFDVVSWQGVDAFKGIKDELPTCNLLSSMYSSSSIGMRAVRFVLNKFLGPVAGHAQLVIARRQSD